VRPQRNRRPPARYASWLHWPAAAACC
jgi:hypothetical protein